MIWRAPPMRAPWMIDSPTPPQPNTATVCPACIARAAQRRADAGQHAAADQRGAVERQVRIDPHDRILVQQHVFGVAADAGERAARRAVLRQPRRARLRARDDAAGAEIRMPAEALRAGAAEARQAGDDMVARAAPSSRRGRPPRRRTGALVAQHERPVERKPAEPVDDVQIAVADAGGDRSHQHLAAPWLVEFYRFDRQRFVHFAKHGCVGFHGIRLSCRNVGAAVTIGRGARRGNRVAGLAQGNRVNDGKPANPRPPVIVGVDGPTASSATLGLCNQQERSRP